MDKYHYVQLVEAGLPDISIMYSKYRKLEILYYIVSAMCVIPVLVFCISLSLEHVLSKVMIIILSSILFALVILRMLYVKMKSICVNYMKGLFPEYRRLFAEILDLPEIKHALDNKEYYLYMKEMIPINEYQV